MKKFFIILGALFFIFWAISYGSCVNKIENTQQPMDFIFQLGSSSEELTNFVNDIKTTYPKIVVASVLTDEDAFNAAVKMNNIQADKIEEYRKTLTTPYDALPNASIEIRASKKDLGTEKKFKDFVSQEFSKYKTLKLRQDSGSGGDRIASFFQYNNFDTQMCVNPQYGISQLYYSFVRPQLNQVKLINHNDIYTDLESSQIRAAAGNINVWATLYFDKYKTYEGICDIKDERVKSMGIDKSIEDASKIVSQNNIYCNSSVNAYVYSIRLPRGDFWCSDNKNLGSTMNTKGEILSCK